MAVTEVGAFRLLGVPASVIHAVRLGDRHTDPYDGQDWEAVAAWCGGDVVNHEVADSGDYTSTVLVTGAHAQGGDWIVKTNDGFDVWPNARFVRDVADPPPSAAESVAREAAEAAELDRMLAA